MTDYVTVKTLRHDFGRSNFVQVQRLHLRDDHTKTTFLAITRGFVDKHGEDRHERFVTMPDEPDVRAWLANALREF